MARRTDPAEETVLITGASTGLGFELAREFARYGHRLILVAPVAMELVTVTQRLQQEHGVHVLPLPLVHDLAEPDAPEKIFRQLEADDLSVDILVNHAGLCQNGPFWEIPIERDLESIRLNIEALIRLTKLILPGMLAQGGGRILNTAPAASVGPGSCCAVYHATNAFVVAWSEALAAELEATGVTVTALRPGPLERSTRTPWERSGGPRALATLGEFTSQDIAVAAYNATMQGARTLTRESMTFSPSFRSASRQADEAILPTAMQRDVVELAGINPEEVGKA